MWGIRANPISIRKCQSHADKKSLLEVGLCNGAMGHVIDIIYDEGHYCAVRP